MTPDQIVAYAKAAGILITAFGTLIMPIATAYQTMKNSYDINNLAPKLRPNADGTPGQRRKKSRIEKLLFEKKGTTK